MASPSRRFEDKPAVRASVPLLVGLVGPSGSGKTVSALRLATGMQRVVGGEIGGVDTEADRMLHYAPQKDGGNGGGLAFNFRHLPFGAPFGPLDYLAAAEHLASKGVRIIIFDSGSHMHEGPGGTLEVHDQETDRLAEKWRIPREKAQMSGWQKPKKDLRTFLNAVLQMKICTIWCFRAKEKVDLRGDKPKPLGFMPVVGDEVLYEMTLNCLLYPNSGGVPSWQPEEMGEKAIIKLPNQFRALFAQRRPLDEATGEALASWAAGGAAPSGAAPLAAGAPSAHPARPVGSAEPSGPKASPDTLAELSEQLGAMGHHTKAQQTLWVRKALGKAIEDLLEEEARQLLDRAQREVAA